VVLRLATVVVVRVLLALPLATFVGIPSVLTQLLHTLQLLLLFLEFLLLLELPLLLLLLAKVVLLLLLDGSAEVEKLTVLTERTGVLGLLLGDLLVEGLAVLLDGVLGVLVNGDLDDAVVLRLLLRVVEVLEVGVREGILDGDAVLGVEDQHAFEQIQRLLVHAGEEGGEGAFLDEGDLVEALLRHH
jgi:hypothetical protein